MKELVVCGITHHDTGVDLREKLRWLHRDLITSLSQGRRDAGLYEVAILSTCNRFEVYGIGTRANLMLAEMERCFFPLELPEIRPTLRLFREDAALHLFRVASGLDSMIVGESHILNQVRAAQEAAVKAGTAGPILHRLFETALHCGKRVKTEVFFGAEPPSVPSIAIKSALKKMQKGQKMEALVIGAGSMGAGCVRHLAAHSFAKLSVYNRSTARLSAIKEKYPDVIAFSDSAQLHDEIQRCQLIVVATDAPDFLISPELLDGAVVPKLIVDISVPRNVHPEVADREGIDLLNIDCLKQEGELGAENGLFREQSEAIVFETLDDFTRWRAERRLAPELLSIRETLYEIGRDYSSRNDVSVDALNGFINAILHEPTVNMRRRGNVACARDFASMFMRNGRSARSSVPSKSG